MIPALAGLAAFALAAAAQAQDAPPEQVSEEALEILTDRVIVRPRPLDGRIGVAELYAPEAGADLSYVPVFLDRLQQAMLRDEAVGLAVAVIEHGEPVLVYTAGEIAAGSARPVTRDTVFRTASVSKTFTGTLLAILEAEGLVDLDHDVPRVFLRLPRERRPTAAEILGQRSGMPWQALSLNLERGAPVETLRGRLANLRPACRPGACYTYQNVAFSTVEELAERATGLSFEEAMQAYVFTPLGLTGASIGETGLVNTGENWARPHRRRERESPLDHRPGAPETAYDGVPSAAGVNLTLNDFIRWAQLQIGSEPGLSEAVRARLHAPQGATPEQTRRMTRLRERVGQTWYGLGWRIYDWNGRTLINHSGYISGVGAQIYIEPETGFGFVALWNTDGDGPWWLFPTLMDLRTGDGPGDWLDRLERRWDG